MLENNFMIKVVDIDNVNVKSHISWIDFIVTGKNQILDKTSWKKYVILCKNLNQEKANDRNYTCGLYGQVGDELTCGHGLHVKSLC